MNQQKQTLEEFQASLDKIRTLKFSMNFAKWGEEMRVLIHPDDGDVLQFIQDEEGNPRTTATGFEFIAHAFHGIQQLGIELRMFGKRVRPVRFEDTSGDASRISLDTPILVDDLIDTEVSTFRKFFAEQFQ